MKKGRLIALIVAPAIVVTALIVLTFGNQGFLDMYRLRGEDKAREREIAAANAEIDSLKAEIERLKNDTAYIEKIARENLGMARKGEKIFKFVEGEE
jgi:cell division protein FtsL